MSGRERELSKPKTQKQSEESIINSIRNIFILEKENNGIKDRIVRDIRRFFDQQDDDYYKPKRVSNFWNNNFIEYESNGNRNKNLSLDEYLDKIRLWLRDIIFDLQESDNRKSSKQLHSKNDNVKFTSYNDAGNVVDEIFE